MFLQVYEKRLKAIYVMQRMEEFTKRVSFERWSRLWKKGQIQKLRLNQTRQKYHWNLLRRVYDGFRDFFFLSRVKRGNAEKALQQFRYHAQRKALKSIAFYKIQVDIGINLLERRRKNKEAEGLASVGTPHFIYCTSRLEGVCAA